MSPPDALSTANDDRTVDPTRASRLRIWFAKDQDLRFLGHRDLSRHFERWFRRAGLQLEFSQGFHPRALMNFPSALAVGIVGQRELMEVALIDAPQLAAIRQRLLDTACPGLDLLSLEMLPRYAPKPRVVAAVYEIDAPPAAQAAAVEAAVARLLAADQWQVTRPRASRPVDLRAGILDLRWIPQHGLQFRLAVDPGGSVRPREVLEALELHDWERAGAVLRRVHVELLTPVTLTTSPTTSPDSKSAAHPTVDTRSPAPPGPSEPQHHEH